MIPLERWEYALRNNHVTTLLAIKENANQEENDRLITILTNSRIKDFSSNKLFFEAYKKKHSFGDNPERIHEFQWEESWVLEIEDEHKKGEYEIMVIGTGLRVDVITPFGIVENAKRYDENAEHPFAKIVSDVFYDFSWFTVHNSHSADITDTLLDDWDSLKDIFE